MNILQQYFVDIGASLGAPAELVTLALLLLFGAVVHLFLSFFVRRLHTLAEGSVMRWDDILMTALLTPLRMALWVLLFYLALDIYPATDRLQAILLQAADTSLILLAAWFLHRLIWGVEHDFLERESYVNASDDRATVRATAKLLRVTLWLLTSLMVLQSLGVSVSGLLAFGGIGGIAVGFAAKDLLANFFGGLGIYLDRPFTVGDWIRSPDKEVEGTVEDIGWRVTRIRTFDQRPLYVPNSVFSQIAIQNPTRMFNRRIYETIGLRYEDADKLAKIVDEVRSMLEQHEAIDLNRTLIVNFVSFGASSLDFFVYTFTRTTAWVEYHAIKQDILLKILAVIHANGADVAFPTRTLHVEAAEPEPTS